MDTAQLENEKLEVQLARASMRSPSPEFRVSRGRQRTCCRGQNRSYVDPSLVGIGEFTAHFRPPILDVHWGLTDLGLTHGHMASCKRVSF